MVTNVHGVADKISGTIHVSKKRRLFGAIGVLVALIAATLYVTNAMQCDVRRDQKLLRCMSRDEKDLLSRVCSDLFHLTPVGYTIFGSKPMSFVSGDEQIPSVASLLRGMAEKQMTFLETKNYLLFLDRTHVSPFFCESMSLYVVNKQLFLAVVQKNISLFRQYLGSATTPEGVLRSCSTIPWMFDNALRGKHVLLGILLGFGTQNSLDFQRRMDIEENLVQQGMPPWQDPFSHKALSQDEQRNLRWNRQIFPSCSTIPGPLSPSPGFSSLEEELAFLCSKFQLSDNDACYDLKVVTRPGFAADLSREDSQSLIERYTEERERLQKLMESETLLESVLERVFQ